MRDPGPDADDEDAPDGRPAGNVWEASISVEAERGDVLEEGLAALAAGDAEAARAAFRAAVDEASGAGHVLDLDPVLQAVDKEATSIRSRRKAAAYQEAWARLWLGCALLARDEADEAEAEALTAADGFRSLEAEAGALAADEVAEAARRRSPAHRPIASMRGPVEGSPLSSREIEILRLVSKGLSNHGIARVLVLSDHTIHRHVANILTKLGVSTRTAAVGVAARRGML